jgi:hypothetical protein
MKNILLFCMLLSSASFAQKVKLVEGSLKPLKGQKAIRVEFTYDNMIVGKDLTEEDYIKRKKEEYNEKEAGRGEKWEKAWVDDRKERFEPQFVELFEKHSSMTTNANDAQYTLVFHTTRTEPGWNVGVMRAPARIDAEVSIQESANPDKVIARLTVVNAPGRDAAGFDFDTGYRIQEAYAKSGKEIAQLLVKQIK